MKRIFPVILMLLVVCGSAAADDYISINLENGDSLVADSHVELVFSLTYECPTVDPMAGLSLGFHIHTTGSATFSHTSGDYTTFHSTDWFNVGGLICQDNDLSGTGLTSGDLLFGGAYNSLFPGDGLPVGTVDEAFITVGIDLGTGTGELCIDSAFVPPGGTWKFSNMTCGQGGAGDRPLFLDSNGSDAYHPICVNIVEAQCQPPAILHPPDTLIGDNCNRIEYDFDADPGGIAGNGNVYWWANLGSIDSLTGEYVLENTSPITFTETVIAINDCSPPESISCSFLTILENQKPVLKDKNPIRADPIGWRRYVYGSEGAESLGVWIEIEGSTEEVKALGIKLIPNVTKNLYNARIGVDQYPLLLKIPNVIRVTPASRRRKANSLELAFSGNVDPKLDESTQYFFADSARRLYNVDGDSILIGIIDEGFDPTNDDFYFDSWDSKVLYFWDMDAPSSAGGTAHPISGRYWTKTDFDMLGGYSHIDVSSDTIGHGTMVAGVAAGTGRKTGGGIPDSTFTGVAPGAYFIFVSLPDSSSNSTTDFANALLYILEKAGQLDMPCVVNISQAVNPDGPRNRQLRNGTGNTKHP